MRRSPWWSCLMLLCVAARAAAGEPVAVPAAAPASTPTAATPALAPAPSVTVPIELHGDRVFVAATLDGRPVKLLLDPGGVNVLDPKAIARLGLAADAELGRAAGVGAARAATLALGGWTLRDPVFYAVDLGRLPQVEGLAFDGVLGQEAVERAVLTIDYAARRLTLAASVAPAADAAPRASFRYADRLPLIEAAVDGQRGDFVLDVGGRWPLLLHGPFVREHRLLERYAHGHEQVVGWDLGGPVRGYATRIGALALDGASVPGVIAHLQEPTRDAPAGRQVAGSIGGGVLKRFTVTLDFVRREYALAPNAALGALEPFDRSGLWLNLDGDDLIIDALLSNGPGARAQLQAHDRIVSLDGVPATQLTLAEARRRLAEAPAGTRVKVTARRDGKVVYATLVLADLVPPASPPKEPAR